MIFLKRRAFMTCKFNYEMSKGIKQVILKNCAQAPFKQFSTLGNSHQDSTTGAQLFDAKTIVRDMVIELDGNLVNTKGYFTSDFIKVEPSATYYINATASKRGKYFDENKKVMFTSSFSDFNPENGAIITTPEKAYYIRFSGLIGNIETIMLNKGSSATPYEPYTGGKPSPSPDYPQEIKNVGKWNEETQKYEVDVKVTGKNLFDVNYFTENENYQNKDGDDTHWKYATLKVEPNTTYTVSKGLASKVNGGINNDFNFAGALFFYNDAKSVKITSKDNGILYVMLYNRNEDVNILKEMDIQVELGEKLTEYQPYKEQTLTLTSDRPITKWDRLVEQGGEIGWLYAGVVIDRFDGQSNIISIANKQGNVQNFSIQFENVANGNGNSDIFVDKYRAVQLSYTKAEYGICCNWNDGVKYFSAPNENVATVDEFKAWLIENPLKIAYETTNPEFVPLPQSEQDAIRALTTYHPTTVITVDGGDVDAGIEVEYAVKNKEKI